MANASLRQLIGMEAAAAYRALLLNHTQVRDATLFQYDAPPHMQERIAVTDAERELIEQANRMRKGTGIPFWEAIFATCAVEEQCTDPILEATFFHNGQGISEHISRRQIEDGVIESTARNTQRTVALGSKLAGAKGALGHMSFLDLHCEVSAGNHVVVHRVCRHVMPQGFLVLDSGGSYHACGVTLVSDDQRIQMLAKALLVSPIVDARYVAHQLLQDSSSLRISRGGSAGKVPIVIDAWAP
jgi:hypothetical protein